ncbi:DUF92 domain-containing protein [Caldivirga maquilingensis]|uniref:DUF92 domain-containing protein n=1 Tax=Caldivirga maquilingensis (strain ATCC 700844 / DSM 13496 / JCM 10307 / IC-167) TaxID=397948 RepID=A8M9W5_CALMQ|nr:DUF92 domain-containing protein [Caldivirga maquilingensis]ABW02436.1 protein of unknown function DUF92 transmembrane [Caldivirga maquilingensis IC-167]
MNNIDVLVTYLVIGLLASVALSIIAVKAKVIRRGAIPQSVLVGTLVTLSGLPSVLLFILFLLYSTIVTRLGKEPKIKLGVAYDLEGRGASQVAAVGFTPSVMAMVSAVTYAVNLTTVAKIFLISYVASLAATSADTWASEIGVLSRGNPFLVTMPKAKVTPGTSGAVTWLGELSSLAGSTAIALTYLALNVVFNNSPNWVKFNWSTVNPTIQLILLILALGYIGEVLDSLLGALTQPKYYCDRCGMVTEQEVHTCGGRTRLIYEPRIKLSNEDVNLLTSLIVAVTAVLVALAFSRLLG